MGVKIANIASFKRTTLVKLGTVRDPMVGIMRTDAAIPIDSNRLIDEGPVTAEPSPS